MEDSTSPVTLDRAMLRREEVAMDVSSQPLRHAKALTLMGVGFVMDDYGVGFSSLELLRNLRFGKLKLDRGFVMALPGARSDRAIIRTTIHLGHGLGMPIVAEGIETDAQLEFLRENGCEMGQGHWYARPMPLHELTEWLARKRVGVPYASMREQPQSGHAAGSI